MSRSNNTDLVNPATRFFEWAGESGKIQYFDKTIGEKGENVDVAMPFKFLVLDRVTQITGGVDRNGKYEGFWSNAVKNIKTQGFTVKSKQGVEAQGLYDEIKGTAGVKFMTGLYIAFYNDEGQLQIGYLKIKGSALTAWIEFTKFYRDIYSGAFGIVDRNQCKKGANTYYEPVFEYYSTVAQESERDATALDKELQEYLTAYFALAGLAETDHVERNGGSPPDREAGAIADDIGFGRIGDEPEFGPLRIEEPPEDLAIVNEEVVAYSDFPKPAKGGFDKSADQAGNGQIKALAALLQEHGKTINDIVEQEFTDISLSSELSKQAATYLLATYGG